MAVKKTQEVIEYGDTEITGSEQMAMASVQFKKVVEQKKSKEQKVLATIKRDMLSDGLGKKAREKLDIKQAINSQGRQLDKVL